MYAYYRHTWYKEAESMRDIGDKAISTVFYSISNYLFHLSFFFCIKFIAGNFSLLLPFFSFLFILFKASHALFILNHPVFAKIDFVFKQKQKQKNKMRILFIKIMQMQYQITVFNKLPHQFSFQSWELVPRSFYALPALLSVYHLFIFYFFFFNTPHIPLISFIIY